jgi:phosphatidylglycerophosphate synthase
MNTPGPAFAGDKKKGQSILGPWERTFIDWAIPRVPRRIMSHHLTMLTLLWSAGTVAFGWLASRDLVWIHGISVMVFGQWLTDSLDGSLGKYRKQGLVKWGFFMDHILDLVFAGCIVIAYAFLAPEGMGLLFDLLLLVTLAMMATSFLSFAATNQFQIAYYGIGPTEIRIGYVALNTFVALAGEEVFWWGVPLVLALNGVALFVLLTQTSRNLWAIDKAANVDGA